jgi:negative regulator of sigma E activity
MCPPAIIPAIVAVGTMAATAAVSAASSNKLAKAQQQQAAAAQKQQAETVNAINNMNTKVPKSVERTANQLRENKTEKRAINSLRIPLNKTNTGTTGINTGDTSQTGLNIPM